MERNRERGGRRKGAWIFASEGVRADPQGTVPVPRASHRTKLARRHGIPTPRARETSSKHVPAPGRGCVLFRCGDECCGDLEPVGGPGRQLPQLVKHQPRCPADSVRAAGRLSTYTLSEALTQRTPSCGSSSSGAYRLLSHGYRSTRSASLRTLWIGYMPPTGPMPRPGDGQAPCQLPSSTSPAVPSPPRAATQPLNTPR